MMVNSYAVNLYQNDEGDWVAETNVPDLVTTAGTKEEALSQLGALLETN